MSIRKLPEVKAFAKPAGLAFEPDDAIVARWSPGVRAATEGDANVVSIYGTIGEDFFGEGVTSKRIASALRHIGKHDVTVNVNSPGGDFFEGVAIYSLLREHPAKVTINVMGLAASAASVIAMAGDEVLMSPVGFLMIHNAWVLAVGNRHDMRAAADTLEPFDDAMAGLYAERAGVEKTVAAGWMDEERWFNGSQAVDLGLADGLLPSSAVSDEGESKALAAIRRVDMLLARQGTPRSERKLLLNEIKGGMPGAASGDDDKPGAVVDVTPGADESLTAGLARLVGAMKS